MATEPKLVLFVCVGNSCRSQMAEGFGNHYGQGKVVAFSAGIAPSGRVHPLATEAMREVGIDITRQTSKSVDEFDITQFDAVVSLCDVPTDELCPATYTGIQEHWNIPDPIGLPIDEFRRVRAMIEERVKELVQRLADDA